MVSPDAPIIGAVDVPAEAAPPVAAFVISISFTALAVVWKMSCSAPLAAAIKPASAILGVVKTGEVKVLFVRVSVDVLATSVSAPEGIVTVPPFVIVAIVGAVKVLLVRVSVVALPTIVSVPVGNVRLDRVEPLPSLV